MQNAKYKSFILKLVFIILLSIIFILALTGYIDIPMIYMNFLSLGTNFKLYPSHKIILLSIIFSLLFFLINFLLSTDYKIFWVLSYLPENFCLRFLQNALNFSFFVYGKYFNFFLIYYFATLLMHIYLRYNIYFANTHVWVFYLFAPIFFTNMLLRFYSTLGIYVHNNFNRLNILFATLGDNPFESSIGSSKNESLPDNIPSSQTQASPPNSKNFLVMPNGNHIPLLPGMTPFQSAQIFYADRTYRVQKGLLVTGLITLIVTGYYASKEAPVKEDHVRRTFEFDRKKQEELHNIKKDNLARAAEIQEKHQNAMNAETLRGSIIRNDADLVKKGLMSKEEFKKRHNFDLV